MNNLERVAKAVLGLTFTISAVNSVFQFVFIRDWKFGTLALLTMFTCMVVNSLLEVKRP